MANDIILRSDAQIATVHNDQINAMLRSQI